MLLIKVLKALADPNRMRLIRMLIDGDLCVGALANQLDISKPAVSQHLRVLRQAGLVRGEKRGYWTHYAVDRTCLKRIATELNTLAETDKSHTSICRRIRAKPASNHPLEEEDICQDCRQKPARLKNKPETGSPEQIQERHRDIPAHPGTRGDCLSEQT